MFSAWQWIQTNLIYCQSLPSKKEVRGLNPRLPRLPILILINFYFYEQSHYSMLLVTSQDTVVDEFWYSNYLLNLKEHFSEKKHKNAAA